MGYFCDFKDMGREQLLPLIATMFPLGTLKVFEYAVKTSAIEMIYMPMSHEERYLGRELVRFFGQKVGKWVSQQALNIITNFISLYCGYKVDSALLLLVCAIVCSGWGYVTMHLAHELINRKGTSCETKRGKLKSN